MSGSEKLKITPNSISGSYLNRYNSLDSSLINEEFLVGYCEVDITPPPLLYTSGYSIEAKRAVGKWDLLKATTFVVSDDNDGICVFVTVDFWAVSQGLLDAVASVVQTKYNLPIGRNHMVISATHTHASCGNIASNNMYNKFASGEPGFNPEYFRFLVEKISKCINGAYSGMSYHSVFHKKTTIFDIGTNRSLEPFRENPEGIDIIRENRAMHPRSVGDNDLAVYPYVKTLMFYQKDVLKAAMVFAPIHPIATGVNTAVYSADIFGLSKRSLQDRHGIVMGYFQGAGGDISPNTGTYDRLTVVSLSKRLTEAVDKMFKSKGGKKVVGKVQIETEQIDLLDRRFKHRRPIYKRGIEQIRDMVTSDEPFGGFAQLGGSSEDAPTILNWLGWKEGVVADGIQVDEAQGNKLEPLDLLKCCPSIAGFMRHMISGKTNIPDKVPITVASIGGIVFATVPGETTTINQYRLEHHMRQTHNVFDTTIIGLANEYVSYFASFHEYHKQHYEGASTLYGQYSTDLLMYEYDNIYSKIVKGVKRADKDSVEKVEFSHEELGDVVVEPLEEYVMEDYDDLVNMIVNNNVKIFTQTTSVDLYNHSDNVWPTTTIQIKNKETEIWEPLHVNGMSTCFLTVLKRKTKEKYEWEHVWLVPDNVEETVGDSDIRCLMTYKDQNKAVPFRLPTKFGADFVIKPDEHATNRTILSKLCCCIPNRKRDSITSAYKYDGDISNVKILSYNIQMIIGKVSDKRTDIIASSIIKDDYDIVCLQELFDDSIKLKMEKKLREVYPFYVSKTNKDRLLGLGEDSGLAVFSKYQILDFDFVEFKSGVSTDALAGKGVMRCRIRIGDKDLTVYNTHLQASYSKDKLPFLSLSSVPDDSDNPLEKYSYVRKMQLDRLVEYVQENKHCSEDHTRHCRQHTNILVGDFNIIGSDPEYEVLKSTLSEGLDMIDTHFMFEDEEKSTYFNKDIRLDYIWSEPNYVVKEYQIKDFNSFYGFMSDHLATTVVLDLSRE